MAVYLLFVAVKGNSTYGYRSACFTFYPVTYDNNHYNVYYRSNETQLNSFLFNAAILNMISVCIVDFMCTELPAFVENTFIYTCMLEC